MQRWTTKTGTVTCIGKWTISLSDAKSYLGEEHHIEKDPLKTASGIERFWIFKVEDQVALAFAYSDLSQELLVGTNLYTTTIPSAIKYFIADAYVPLEGIMWD